MEFASESDRAIYEAWSKQDIYLTYLAQVRATEGVAEALRRAELVLAKIRFDLKDK